MSSDLTQPYRDALRSHGIKPAKRALLVSLAEQRLEVMENGAVVSTYPVSTGRKPPSCLEGSGGTPTGLHRIAAKIGDGAAPGAVFRGRVEIGKTYSQLSPEEQRPNLVTSRILWLDGLEEGHNQGPGRDSYQRYIYIHGTNHEDAIGQPASGGCVQLANLSMIELFDRAEEGDHVFIL